jgi:hypothetical protein
MPSGTRQRALASPRSGCTDSLGPPRAGYGLPQRPLARHKAPTSKVLSTGSGPALIGSPCSSNSVCARVETSDGGEGWEPWAFPAAYAAWAAFLASWRSYIFVAKLPRQFCYAALTWLVGFDGRVGHGLLASFCPACSVLALEGSAARQGWKG